MAKIIKQYCNQNVSDVIIYQLGIQAPQGTIFTINDGGEIVMGPSGIFQVELDEGSFISSVKITKLPANKPNASFYIDVIQEEE